MIDFYVRLLNKKDHRYNEYQCLLMIQQDNQHAIYARCFKYYVRNAVVNARQYYNKNYYY